MIINSYKYHAPHLDTAAVWLNLDPTNRDLTGGASTIENWRNALDTSDNFTNSNTARRPTDSNTHITFDGGDFMECSDRTFDTSATGWTIIMRYTESNWSDNSALVGDDNSNNYFIKNVGDKITVKMHNGSGVQSKDITFDTPADLVDSTIYTIAVTCDTSARTTVYIDAVAQTDVEVFGSTAYDMVVGQIGAKNGAVWMVDGTMQEVLMWAAPLSSTQVLDVHTYLINKF